MKRALALSAVVTVGSMFVGCGAAPVSTEDGRIYHCVGTDHPIPPPNTFAPKTPLKYFEYGEYRDSDRPTISGSSYCGLLPVPQTARLEYESEGRLLRKQFDLSTLTPQRVWKKTVVFYVDRERVEVRLQTPRQGALPNIEVIDVK